MEKRNFTRVEFTECASVRYDDQVFFCDTINIGLQGLYIKTGQELPLDAEVEITVYYSQDSSIRLNANVVHCEELGLGLKLMGIDVHSFVHLRDVVAVKNNDQDRIIRETFRMARYIQ
jgi:hypothetical protein